MSEKLNTSKLFSYMALDNSNPQFPDVNSEWFGMICGNTGHSIFPSQ